VLRPPLAKKSGIKGGDLLAKPLLAKCVEDGFARRMSTSVNHTNQIPSTRASGPNLLYGDQALADAIHAGRSTIRTWRSKRLIPYIKTGHKTVIYDLNKVLAALGALEVKPVTGKGGK
jgi:hypothetical protein